MEIPLNEWWLPILAFVLIVLAYLEKKKTSRKVVIELIVGFLVLGLSINDNYVRGKDHKALTDSLNTVINKEASIQDTLDRTRDTLLGLGIKIDSTTGKILLIDSQLLKRRVTQIINNNSFFYGSQNTEADKKLNKFFEDLSNPDGNKRGLALNYILENFPDTLSKAQLKNIQNCIFKGNVNQQLMELLSEQPPSDYLTSFMKDLLLNKAPTQYYIWRYLFTKTNMELPFIESIIKSDTSNCWDIYRAVVSYTLDNPKMCFALLNDKDIISFLLANKNIQTQQTYDFLNRDATHPNYEKYKKTYFFSTNSAQ